MSSGKNDFVSDIRSIYYCTHISSINDMYWECRNMYRLKASREVAQPNHGLVIVDNLPTRDMHTIIKATVPVAQSNSYMLFTLSVYT